MSRSIQTGVFYKSAHSHSTETLVHVSTKLEPAHKAERCPRSAAVDGVKHGIELYSYHFAANLTARLLRLLQVH